MARLSRGVAGAIIALILALVVILVLSGYFIYIASQPRTYLESRSVLREYLFEASEEHLRVDVLSSYVGGSVSLTYSLRNTGSVPVTIVRAWVLRGGLPQPYNIRYTIPPGAEMNLNTTAAELGLDDVSKILFLVTARGNIIPVSAEYQRLNLYIQPSRGSSGASPQQQPLLTTSSIGVDNFTILIEKNRVDAYYKRPTDQECNLRGQPVIDVIDPTFAPYKALMINMGASGKPEYNIMLSNAQTACNRFVFSLLVSYVSQGDRINTQAYVRVLVGVEAVVLERSRDDLVYVTISLRLIDRDLSKTIASASQTTAYILYRPFEKYFFRVPAFMVLDSRFLDPNYLRNKYFDLEVSVTLRLVASGGDSYEFRIGLMQIDFLGAEVRI